MSWRALRSCRLPTLVCLVIAAASALPAAYDLWKVVSIAVAQLHGPADGTDFLNLYSGASLFSHRPHVTYQLDEQLTLQRSLTGRESLLVPFYLPPYAAVLVSWLGWLPYGVAYVVWLVLNVASVLLSIHFIAPRWTGWYVLVWFGLALLFLPMILSLAQGQTSALLLLACAGFVRGFTSNRPQVTGMVMSTLGWLLKPQLAAVVLVALVLSRRWRILATTAVVLGALGTVAALRLGPAGMTSFLVLSQHKTHETLTADPVFLIGPTLLHASHWFLGVHTLANVLAVLLDTVVLAATVFIWRRGIATDDRLLLQLALVPIASVIAAPYALIYELTPWLVSFWLLWRYTANRRRARAVFLWLVAGIWVSANVGVAEPRAGGADVAALFGLCLVAFIAWLSHKHTVHVDPNIDEAQQSPAHLLTA